MFSNSFYFLLRHFNTGVLSCYRCLKWSVEEVQFLHQWLYFSAPVVTCWVLCAASLIKVWLEDFFSINDGTAALQNDLHHDENVEIAHPLLQRSRVIMCD